MSKQHISKLAPFGQKELKKQCAWRHFYLPLAARRVLISKTALMILTLDEICYMGVNCLSLDQR